MSEKIGYQAVKEREGIILNANESSENLPRTLRRQIADALMNIDFHRYPQDEATMLCEAYARYIHADSSQIIAGNGSDEMLGLMIALYIGEGKKLYTLSPDFSMYDYYVGMHNGTVVRYPRKAEEAFDTEDFITKGKAEKVDLVLFSNPNNPTGQIIEKKDLCRIAAAFDCPVIIDEAYGEFADDTMIDQLDRYENLFVTRTLSKAFALAAVRCGFLIGNKAAMKKIRSCKVPYNVNTMTQCAAQIVLSNRDELLKRRDEIIQERSRMEQACARYDTDLLRIYPSHANFFYGRSSRKEELLKLFEKQNIVIRNYADDSFRITIGTKEENDQVLAVLQSFEEEYR